MAGEPDKYVFSCRREARGCLSRSGDIAWIASAADRDASPYRSCILFGTVAAWALTHCAADRSSMQRRVSPSRPLGCSSRNVSACSCSCR